MEEALTFPEWVTSHHYRPTNMELNLTRIRKEATDKVVGGGYAVLHHHGAEAECTAERVHEYFGFGKHSQCGGKGCSFCELGWRKHNA